MSDRSDDDGAVALLALATASTSQRSRSSSKRSRQDFTRSSSQDDNSSRQKETKDSKSSTEHLVRKRSRKQPSGQEINPTEKSGIRSYSVTSGSAANYSGIRSYSVTSDSAANYSVPHQVQQYVSSPMVQYVAPMQSHIQAHQSPRLVYHSVPNQQDHTPQVMIPVSMTDQVTSQTQEAMGWTGVPGAVVHPSSMYVAMPMASGQQGTMLAPVHGPGFANYASHRPMQHVVDSAAEDSAAANKLISRLLKSALSRDAYCAAALCVKRLSTISFDPRPEAHVCAAAIGETAHCNTCDPGMCRCIRDHFQSTANSKRRVSTHLFWKTRLGMHFPIGDILLHKTVWSALESCEFGIKQGNGQRKNAKGGVCINPYHYRPTDYHRLLTPLMSYLVDLNMHTDHAVAAIAASMQWTGIEFLVVDRKLAAIAFEQLTNRLRQMVEVEDVFAGHVSLASMSVAKPRGGNFSWVAARRNRRQNQKSSQSSPKPRKDESHSSSDSRLSDNETIENETSTPSPMNDSVDSNISPKNTTARSKVRK